MQRYKFLSFRENGIMMIRIFFHCSFLYLLFLLLFLDNFFSLSNFLSIMIGTTTLETMEYVPVSLPCIPAHPLVDIQLYKWPPYSDLPPGLVYNPRTGYEIEEPVQKKHNGTYLCVFTDNSGTKISKLVIHLNVKRKVNRKVFVEVNMKSTELICSSDLKNYLGY